EDGGGEGRDEKEKNSTREVRRPHEEFLGRPSRLAISSSRFLNGALGPASDLSSVSAAGAGGRSGGTARAGRGAGASGAIVGARSLLSGLASPPLGRRSAASSRCAISARF